MKGGRGRRGVRAGAVVAVAVVAGFLVWLLVIHDSGGSGSTANLEAGAGPVAATEGDLTALSDELGQPVYWAGPQPDTRLELTHTTDGRIYVRYLTGAAQLGSTETSFLTIGTYPFKDPYGVLQQLSHQPGAIVRHTDNGGLVVEQSTSTSVYIAYPHQNFQVEVYDPNAKRALSLATSGVVRPVG